MRHLISFLVIAGALAIAAEPPPEKAPSIREMRAAAEEHLAPRKPAVAEEDVPASLKAEREGLVKGIEAFHGRLYRERNRLELGDLYADVAKYEKALEAYAEMRKHDWRHWSVQSGDIDLRVARARGLQGETEEALDLAEKVRGRTEEEWVLRRARQTLELLKGMPEARESEKKALEKLKENPKDADAQWSLCELYRRPIPWKYEEVRRLLAMRALFPEHDRVKGGECEWRLSEGYWHFGMRDEALALVKGFTEKYPKHWATENGEARWRLAEYLYRLERFAEAEALYEGFVDKFPEHWASRGRRGESPRAIQRLLECRRRIRHR